VPRQHFLWLKDRKRNIFAKCGLYSFCFCHRARLEATVLHRKPAPKKFARSGSAATINFGFNLMFQTGIGWTLSVVGAEGRLRRRNQPRCAKS